MPFVTLVHLTKKPTFVDPSPFERTLAEQERTGIRAIGFSSTFGRYGSVRHVEAPDERTMRKALLTAPERVPTETLLALRREDVAPPVHSAAHRGRCPAPATVVA